MNNFDMSILTELSRLSSSLSTTTQKIVVTNNYDMPILTELLQLSPSQSPELKSMKTSNSTESLLHKFVNKKVNSTTDNVISIPDIDDNVINEIISKGQLLMDSIESSLLAPTNIITMSLLSKSSPKKKKKLAQDRMVKSSVSHPAPLCSKRKSKKVVIEQQRQSR